jgi:hypothetical protein
MATQKGEPEILTSKKDSMASKLLGWAVGLALLAISLYASNRQLAVIAAALALWWIGHKLEMIRISCERTLTELAEIKKHLTSSDTPGFGG